MIEEYKKLFLERSATWNINDEIALFISKKIDVNQFKALTWLNTYYKDFLDLVDVMYRYAIPKKWDVIKSHILDNKKL